MNPGDELKMVTAKSPMVLSILRARAPASSRFPREIPTNCCKYAALHFWAQRALDLLTVGWQGMREIGAVQNPFKGSCRVPHSPISPAKQP